MGPWKARNLPLCCFGAPEEQAATAGEPVLASPTDDIALLKAFQLQRAASAAANPIDHPHANGTQQMQLANGDSPTTATVEVIKPQEVLKTAPSTHMGRPWTTVMNSSKLRPGPIQPNACPFGHGSVSPHPYPGYVHGRNPAVCKHGCTPDPFLGKNGREGETVRETLLREALEFQTVYHKDFGNSDDVKAARIKEITAEIEATGTYTHTYAELQHGARVAWRNAPKCSNRKFWEELNLIDKRNVQTPEDMMTACLELLEVATLSCVTTANIVVFRPETPGKNDGPRVWNNQLLRFAGYEQADGSVLGDPSEKEFTKMLQRQFGWKLPPVEQRTAFDILPIVLQAHPSQVPRVFEVPPHYVARVHFVHPDYPQFASLGLQWYAVPAVSNLDLTIGGITYTACPFNGWYATTEIVRNLTDEGRYNMCLPVAKKLGINTKGEDTMWRDKAITEITTAIMHSFKEAGLGMVCHHTLIKNFYGWYHKELNRRGYCPGNWKWIIPPVSSSASRCYLELNHMTEYTIKPAYFYGPGWRKFLQRMLDEIPGRHVQAPSLDHSNRVADAKRQVSSLPTAKVAIIFASVTGNTQRYAEQVASVLSAGAQVTMLNVEDFEPDHWAEVIAAAKFFVLMSCTHGPGAPPTAASKFIAWSEKAEGKEVLAGKHFTMLGFGSSCYPRFCAAADQLAALLQSAGALPLVPVARADAMGFEELAVWECIRSTAEAAAAQQLLDEGARSGITGRIPVNSSGQVAREFQPRLVMAKLGKPEGLVVPPDRLRVPAKVVECKELLGKPAESHATRLVSLDVTVAGVTVPYLTGDSVAIYGQNPPAVVQAFAKVAGIVDLDEMFMVQDIEQVHITDGVARTSISWPQPNTFRNVLTQYLALMAPLSYESMSALLKYAPADSVLSQLSTNFKEFKEWCSDKGARFCDVFDLFPALRDSLPLSVFLQLCPAVSPRYYSISSSLSTSPGQLHVTIGKLTYKLHNGKERNGFCSSFLCSRNQGDTVHIKVSPTPGFRMPLDVSAPIIMVAAGTGIAPFKGFIEERQARQEYMAQSTGITALGPAALLFGCRDPNKDHIYQQLFAEAKARGVLSHVLVAYSRHPTQRKMYVQDLIAQNSKELLVLLNNLRCHVYVCGSSNMAQEVAVAFARVMGARPYKQMVQESRYHEDVFGMMVDQTTAKKQAASATQASELKVLSKLPLAEIMAKLDAARNGGIDLLSQSDEFSSTLLHMAATDGNVPLLATLATHLGTGMINMADMFGRTPLQCARLAGKTEAASVLTALGGMLVSSLHSSFYPLHAAALAGNSEEMRRLLDTGVDIDHADYNGLVVLHIAAIRGDVNMVDLLIKYGAALDVTNRRGMSALQLATMQEHKAVAEMLRAAGASLVSKPVTAAAAGAGKEAWDATSAAKLMESAGITTQEVAAMQASWATLGCESRPQDMQEQLEKVGVDLFLALFQQHPRLLQLFPFKNEQGQPIIDELKVHGAKVVGTLGLLLDKLSNSDALYRYVEDLVERHIKYGVQFVHYEMVLGVLYQFLHANLAGLGAWDATLASGWRKLFDMVTTLAAKFYNDDVCLGGPGAPPAAH